MTKCPDCKSRDVENMKTPLKHYSDQESWICHDCGNIFELDDGFKDCEACKYYDQTVDLDKFGVPCGLNPARATPGDAECYRDILEMRMPGEQADLDQFGQSEGDKCCCGD